jgi:SnoaL-like domain
MGNRIEDREAIREVIAAYAHAVDRRRWTMMERLFHPDAIFGFGSIEGDWRGFVEQAKAIIDPCIATQHQLGQTLIAFDGPDAADTETYMTAMHIIPPGYPATSAFPDKGENYSAVIAGRYVDRFERRGGEWRIARRQGLYDWREYRLIGEADLATVPQSARGYHDDRDPSTPVAAPWLR